MRLVRYFPTLSVVFCLLTVAAFADSKQKRDVTFSNHVVVSGIELEPGNYVVRWDGTGTGAQLRFMRDGKEVVSVSGNVLEEKNPYSSITTDSGPNDSRRLTKIAFSDVTLVITPEGASTAQ